MRFVNVAEYVRLTGVPRYRVMKMISEGLIHSTKIPGSKLYYITVDDLPDTEKLDLIMNEIAVLKKMIENLSLHLGATTGVQNLSKGKY